MLVDTFCKKFDIGEFEHYFFETRERISREDFIRKSQGINNSISSNMYEKIFDYLVPTPKDEITTLAFKLKFPYSSNAELD